MKSTRLPDHVPVIGLPPARPPAAAGLLACLLARLDELGARAAVLDPAETPAGSGDIGWGVARELIGFDLLFTSNHFLEPPALLALGTGSAGALRCRGGPSFSCRDRREVEPCAAEIAAWAAVCRERTPVNGAVLIGGKSVRMGQPKHLIRAADGKTWLERIVAAAAPQLFEMALSGAGSVPGALSHLARVPDRREAIGPLAGIAALMRHRPFASWLVMACDMPAISTDCVCWLLAQRQRRDVAVIPENRATGKSEPLFAWYDYRSGPMIDDLLERGVFRASSLAGMDLVRRPPIPAGLEPCWRNVNRPEES